jgi:hypothetical protein
MTIRVSRYQTLNMEQLKQFATTVNAQYGKDPALADKVELSKSPEEVVTHILNLESKLYDEMNEDKVQISNVFEDTFNKIKGGA